ncbi:MAG: hypothetical protein ACRDBX_07775, partial [Erysipelotrichaceae bacterium]
MKKGIVIVLLILSGLLGVANLILIAGRSVEVVQQGSTLFYGGIIALFTMLMVVMSVSTLKQEDPKHGLLSVIHVLLSGVLIVNLLLVSDALVLPVQAALPDFTNQAISDVNEWAQAHDIEVVTHEVYADTIAPYHVVGQNVPQGTLAKNIETLEISLSVGPNYDEVVTLTNMVGWDFESVNAEVEALHLINYTMNFVEHESIAREILLTQDKSGELKRNTELLLTFSLGPKGSLQPVELIDF